MYGNIPASALRADNTMDTAKVFSIAHVLLKFFLSIHEYII